MTLDVGALRRAEFPWADSGEAIYLNCASTGPLPARTVAAIAAFNDLRAAPHRVPDELQFATLDRSRELIATLIGARTDEIALAVNTGYGTNLATHALPLGPGDVVIGAKMEFPANVYPWMDLARRRGIEYRMVEPTEEAVLEALEDEAVRAVALSWVEFASGYRFDLEVLSRACRARGAFLVIDAMQGLGPLELDLSRCEIDILTCGGQKWLLSPWGTGFVYVRRELIERLDPPVVSWYAVQGAEDFTRLTDYDLTWRTDARRFELVTLPYQDFVGLNASLELLLELGPGAVARQVAALADRIVDWALARGDVELITPADPLHRGGIVALRPPDAAAASARLRAAGVIHTLREGGIRLSPHCFNTTGEIDRVLAVLEGR